MYIPDVFAQDQIECIHAFIQQNNFGILISQTEEFPFTSQVPFFYDPTVGENGALYTHLATQNPHLCYLERDPKAMVIFNGPHAYISPTWTENQLVPTWNYTVVNAYGTAKVIEDIEKSERILIYLAAKHEGKSGWTMDAIHSRKQALFRAVRTIEIKIDRFEGKFKLSQNRPPADQEKIQDKLLHSSSQMDRQVGQWMMTLLHS